MTFEDGEIWGLSTSALGEVVGIRSEATGHRPSANGTVRLTQAEFDALPEFSTSRPPSTPVGFFWKRNKAMKRRPTFHGSKATVGWEKYGEDWIIGRGFGQFDKKGRRCVAVRCGWYVPIISDEGSDHDSDNDSREGVPTIQDG